MFKTVTASGAAALVALALAASSASAVTLQIEITNTQGPDGLSLTPFLNVFHDGSYDPFDAGGLASAGVEAIAEEGDVSVELASIPGLTSGVATAPGGFPGAPVIEPGETATVRIDVDPTTERYFTFLSMVIPSNDLFVGNDNPLAYEIFDAFGEFNGAAEFIIDIATIWDAGTEANTNLGAAFNTAGGTATDTVNPIQLISDLSFLNGEVTPVNTLAGLGSVGSLGTIGISVVPLPAGLPLFLVALGGFGLLARRKNS